MKKNSLTQIILFYIKDNRKTIMAYIIFTTIFVIVFLLYSIQLEPILYAFLLSIIAASVFATHNFITYLKKHKRLYMIQNQTNINLDTLPEYSNSIEYDYQSILKRSYAQTAELISKIDIKQTETIDYYTLWAHQIKTPIAAIRLILQNNEYTEQNKELLEQTFKIEQYVEMVLSYLKIDSSTSDLVLKNYDLLQIIKQVIRKYAHIFIRKNITLDLGEIDCTVLTDEKWLVFVIEQILWNALKYTKRGKISIYMENGEDKILVIKDTGIGIAEEDLPRIFEKGFTGYNGRMDKKATGIGLYLCKKILNKLSHTITITSEIDKGTKVKINLSSVKTIIE
ncbi:sensor histidine kinase [Clostridium fermenticellae]|uniref:histidine kinase n=1 Tax=Clostridium fermenticellae TaxID=2068654 RepID=A0A386H147_9CLOT|nr:sensor histidine kinase [Clostridium fermenticellae]AYD39394.1 sensor histidine kinase [Clostridium fermenticellae]